MSIFIGSGSISNVLYSSGPGQIASGNMLQLEKQTFGGTSSSVYPYKWLDFNGIETNVIDTLNSSGSIGWLFPDTDTTILKIPSSSLTGKIAGDTSNQPFTIQFFGALGGQLTNPSQFSSGLIGNPNSGENAYTRDIRFVSKSGDTTKMFVQLTNLASSASVEVDYVSGSATGITIAYGNNLSASIYQNGILKGNCYPGNGGNFTLFYTGSVPGADTNIFFGPNRGLGVGAMKAFTGQLGSLYLWNRELNAEEVLSAYNYASTGGTIAAQTVYLGSELVFAQPTTTTTTTTSTTTTLGPLSVQTLVVAGGGSGGSFGGGGGAGGVVYSSSLSLTPGTYAVNVGSGGVAVGINNNQSPSGLRGQDSSLVSGSIIVSASGGGGGLGFTTASVASRNNGGSGGGGYNQGSTSGTGISGQGNNGDTQPFDNACGSGGGGASQAGQKSTPASNGSYLSGRGGAGGSGSAYTIRSGTSVFYGGGGGGGSYQLSVAAGLGGPGGGGNGSITSTNPASASANTGGGGGGSFRSSNGLNNGISGNGGSGIIIIAYTTSSAAGRTITGGIEETYTSASLVYKSHTFLSSSNLVIS